MNKQAEVWDAVAPAWGANADALDGRHAGLTELLLNRAAIQPGQRVLELACGPGSIGIAAAGRVGAGGHVVLTDISPAMTAVAAERASAAGLTNFTTKVMDLAAIDEPDGSYDAVLCRDGLQFAADPKQALAQIRQVLRPDGRLSIATWGARDANPWLGLVFQAASQQLGAPDSPGPFRLGDPDELAALFAAAGLVEVDVTQLAVPMRVPGFEPWWQRTCALAGPLAAVLAKMTPADLDGVRERARAAVQPFTTADGILFPGLALIAAGRRPR